MKLLLATMALSITVSNFGYAKITLAGDSAAWKPVLYPGTISDYPLDTQANSIDLDIVGDAKHPGFYTLFDNGGTDSISTDGEVGFRLRMVGDQGQPTFAGQAWVGIDVTGDGALDIFVGANKDSLGIHDAGTGLNISPSTTSINSTATWSTATSPSNFLWTAVTPALDSLATNFDLDNDSKPDPDYFLTFVVPFGELVNAVSTLTGITTFDDTSPLAYVAATSTQGNSLNSDLNGVKGDINSTISWSDLSALSPAITVDGEVYNVPEPAQLALATGLATLLILLHRRRR